MDTHIPAYPAETIKAFDARQNPCSATRYVLSIDLTIESNIGEIARSFWEAGVCHILALRGDAAAPGKSEQAE